MISRINKAPVLKLVTAQPKQSENDPGSSQGSGMFYDGPLPESKKEEEPSEPNQTADENLASEEESKPPTLKVIEGGGKPKIQSLNLVYEEFFKKKKDGPGIGLTTQYSGDTAPAKGMLLNRKAE